MKVLTYFTKRKENYIRASNLILKSDENQPNGDPVGFLELVFDKYSELIKETKEAKGETLKSFAEKIEKKKKREIEASNKIKIPIPEEEEEEEIKKNKKYFIRANAKNL